MNLTCKIRPCTIEQIPEVIDLIKRTFGPVKAEYAQSFAAQLAFDPQSILVAEWDGKIIGCVTVIYSPLLTSIYDLAVDESYRQMGLAANLLITAEAMARQRGTRAMQAYVYEDNEPSLRLFERCFYGRNPKMVVSVGR